MATNKSQAKLLVIVGPTASGKSQLALKLAKRFNGEIISADSRTIYKGLDVGTAKPTLTDQKEVPHWGLNLIRPGERFTAADFKRFAEAIIYEIKSRSRLPVMVGGTGLYIDSVIYDFSFGPEASLKSRQELERLTVNELREIITKRKLTMPENDQNKRHLIRSIERGKRQPGKRLTARQDAIIVGLLPNDKILRERIAARAETMFRQGVLEETKELLKNSPDVKPENAGLIYKICSEIIKGDLTEEQGLEKIKTLDWQYARRQRTWFRRHPEIMWFESAEAAESYLTKALNN